MYITNISDKQLNRLNSDFRSNMGYWAADDSITFRRKLDLGR